MNNPTRSPSPPLSGKRHHGRISQAYDRLRELIVSGRLAPGTRIVENTLAERLDVSRTPVRSALQRLQQEGYVLANDGGKQARLTVSPLTREDGRELFWIVGELEALAAYWAAQLPSFQRTELVRDLRGFNQKLQAASGDGGPDARNIFDLHTQFHLCYVEAARGTRLLALHQSIKPQAERYRRLYSSARGTETRDPLNEHEVIIRRIEEGDADGAERAVQANWRNAAERLAVLIDTMGERGSW
ncbi:MAG: GntR family transcriptional regulator [Gemmatimonadetes bacterium]|nr:GntR family transcriptional regulator [Gemmatimonadota bacterium]